MFKGRAIEAEKTRIIIIRNSYKALMKRYLKLKYKDGIKVFNEWLFRWEKGQNTVPYEGLNAQAWEKEYHRLILQYERLNETHNK